MPCELTTTNCRGLAYSREHIVQLSGKTLGRHFPELHDGDYLLLSNTNCALQPEIPVKIQRDDDLEVGEIGVGTNVHRAIGVNRGDSVLVSKAPEPPIGERPLYQLLQSRPAICRVRKSVLPDPEFRVCRIPEEVMSLIGIAEGDKVILESSTNTTDVRALRITDHMRQRKEEYIERNPDRYPECETLLLPDRSVQDSGDSGNETRAAAARSDGGSLKHEVPVDIPPVYIDFDTRAELGLTSAPHVGVCQPVRIYRHNRSVALDLLDDLTLPVLALFLSLILLVGNALAIETRLLIVVVGIVLLLVLIVLQGVYRARRNI